MTGRKDGILLTVGDMEGPLDGTDVEAAVGDKVGLLLGDRGDGAIVGLDVIFAVGTLLGLILG